MVFGSMRPYTRMFAKITSDEERMVELRGVEPLTSSMPWKRSSQLSYSPTRVSGVERVREWCARQDLNLRLPDPQSGVLSGLNYGRTVGMNDCPVATTEPRQGIKDTCPSQATIAALPGRISLVLPKSPPKEGEKSLSVAGNQLIHGVHGVLQVPVTVHHRGVAEAGLG